MKKFALLTAIAVVGLLTANNVQASFISTNALPVTIKMTAIIASSDVTKTNGSTVTDTVKGTKVKITTQDILNLLGTEFGDNYTGDVLAYNENFSGFEVADANGNIVKNVSTNLSDSSYRFDLTNHISSSEIVIGKSSENLSTTTTTASETIYEADEILFYKDGSGNDFHFGGLVTATVTEVQSPSSNVFKTINFSIPSSGAGTFFNPNDDENDESVMYGTVTLTGKNILL